MHGLMNVKNNVMWRNLQLTTYKTPRYKEPNLSPPNALPAGKCCGNNPHTTQIVTVQLVTGWKVRGLNLVGGARFSAPVQTGPGAHPASYTMGTGSLSMG